MAALLGFGSARIDAYDLVIHEGRGALVLAVESGTALLAQACFEPSRVQLDALKPAPKGESEPAWLVMDLDRERYLRNITDQVMQRIERALARTWDGARQEPQDEQLELFEGGS